ncbi:hypothetical protein [Polyangium sp. y55x31]|uniref:hypothetical protein n=1 Tax=Polyangium sp. y55x31 TaxID=3042688 RepID=UPI002482DA36|nr:hypothetical protein [Polyangium sp. y55x31]MDI1477334.1 hypothetical protein [Polyangium sp. y55x31]
MKYTSVTWLVLGLFGASFTACATSERPEFGNQPSGGDGGYGGDVGTGGSGGEGGAGGSGSTASSSSSSSGGGPVCVDQCNADADCQNSCPAAPQGAVNCCDVPTHGCYVVGSSTCPTGQGGSGGTPMY